MKSLLDILSPGWYKNEGEKGNVSEWVSKLADKIEAVRDVMVSKHSKEIKLRKDYYA